MSYEIVALIPVIIFILVHFYAKKITTYKLKSRGVFLSIGGGVAIAYVFVDLLPKLGEGEVVVKHALKGFLPSLQHHVYLVALLGFLLFFLIDRSKTIFPKKGIFWASLVSYALFNFFVGYAVVDVSNPEVQPLVLFTTAIALHYFTNDYALNKNHGKAYNALGKWILVVSLFAGWLLGLWVVIPPASIALVDAFIGGGMIMNVIRHELPADNPNSLEAFIISALGYSAILLFVGV